MSSHPVQCVHFLLCENTLAPPVELQTSQLRKEEDLVISVTQREREVIPNLSLPEYFPDQFIGTLSQLLGQSKTESTRQNIQKKILFEVLIKYYQHRSCLLTDGYTDIHLGIIELLENNQTTETPEATQPYLKIVVQILTNLTVSHRIFPLGTTQTNTNFSFYGVIPEEWSWKLLPKQNLQAKRLSKAQAEQLLWPRLEYYPEPFSLSQCFPWAHVLLNYLC
ncbi:DEP domain-containing protein 4 [Peromyscus californicus insignis]|uniref:DEP domain-containing protein 4 n=1 Tax=Peromyscus californicus insignis TaxID=564181 RepID=UPI0022A79EE1|nr:DEP domain-containing protein 4 [Peromyscus californicus insignis]